MNHPRDAMFLKRNAPKRRALWAACLAPLLLAACGGGSSSDSGSGSGSPSGLCSVPEHKAWIGDYMNE